MGTRRGFLRALAAAGVGLSGCADSSSSAEREADIVAGPDSRLVFEPGALTVAVGASVTWYFASSGHNVSCVPGDHDEISLPAGVEPFSSYGEDEPFHTVPRGETYTHTFETPGTYRYVCIPHATAGMAGEIEVAG